MSETKHTPGPWAADIEGANTNSVSILGPDPRLEVATIINDGDDLTDTDLANARLIAAAPALLEALIDITARLKWADDVDVRVGEHVGAYEAIKRAEAAIRQAKGL